MKVTDLDELKRELATAPNGVMDGASTMANNNHVGIIVSNTGGFEREDMMWLVDNISNDFTVESSSSGRRSQIEIHESD